MNKFYVTTPIYYANGVPHIGSAYTTIAADILNRYHRMLGEKTFFLAGTDEHGEKNEESARAAGLEPQKFVDQNSARFQLAWDSLSLTYDRFIRTTEKEHVKAVSKALQHLYDRGYIYKGKHEGLYCVGCEQYKVERDLVDGKCPLHKTVPELKMEEGYMFKLSAFADELKKKIESDEMKISPIERKNEVIAFYEQGLKDISFSRKNLKWGVPLPWDKAYVAYVWPDAFLNYLTGLGWDGTAGKIPEMWPADTQLVGKDIIRVHATIWPAMLLGLDLPLPKRFFVHGFLTIDGQKMSKTIGNVVDPVEVSQKFGLDVLRYFLFREVPFGKDGDFSLQRLAEIYKSDLMDGLGNLVSRTLALAERYYEKKVPEVDIVKTGYKIRLSSGKSYEGFRNCFKVWWDYIKSEYMELKLEKILAVIFGFTMDKENRGGIVPTYNSLINDSKLWELVEKDQSLAGEILYDILEGFRQIALMIAPFMPETSDKILKKLGLESVEKQLQSAKNFKDLIKWGILKSGSKIDKGEALFPRR